jgi:hypothetical protein
VNESIISFKLDTAAQVNVISEAEFKTVESPQRRKGRTILIKIYIF